MVTTDGRNGQLRGNERESHRVTQLQRMLEHQLGKNNVIRNAGEQMKINVSRNEQSSKTGEDEDI